MSRSISRKQFLLVTAASTSALLTACGEEAPVSTRNNGTGGGAGSGGGATTGGSGGGSAGTGTSGSANGGSSTAGSSASGGSSNGGSAGSSGGTSGGTGGSGGTSGEACVADVVAEISCPHDHALTVPAADIMAGVTKSYDIEGLATHSHIVEITAEDFATLKAGGTVFKFVEAGDFQDHCVTLSCGTAGNPEEAPACNLGNAFTCE